MPRKFGTTITITGAYMTELRQQELGQALMITLAHVLDGEIDGVTVTFEENT